MYLCIKQGAIGCPKYANRARVTDVTQTQRVRMTQYERGSDCRIILLSDTMTKPSLNKGKETKINLYMF